MPDLDPAAVEANQHRDEWVSYCSHVTENGVECDCAPDLLETVEALAEARASLERERKARHAAERVNADEVLRKRTNLEARIEVAEMEHAEAVARAEAAERERDYAQYRLHEVEAMHAELLRRQGVLRGSGPDLQQDTIP